MEQEISGLKVCRQLLLLQTLIQIRPQVVIFTGLLQRCKQWGINTGGAVRTSTLPIPFTNVFLAVASTSSEWCCPGCSATNTTVTTRAYQSNRPDVAQPNDVNWIIIGCQPQWGFTNNTGRPYITFPFKFSNVFTAISCICHNGSPSEANTVYNVSISGMNIGASGGGSGKYWCAFGVAQQQWGKYTNSGNDRVITYPIAFSELYYANVISSDNCETFVYGISNININYRLCNGYNDDRWNGTQTSRLFAVGR